MIGDSYVGEYKWGIAEGYGLYRWANGHIYSGEFLNGMKSGQGQWKKNENDEYSNQYIGKYKNDMKHGYGEFKWTSGSKYLGNYVKDKK